MSKIAIWDSYPTASATGQVNYTFLTRLSKVILTYLYDTVSDIIKFHQYGKNCINFSI